MKISRLTFVCLGLALNASAKNFDPPLRMIVSAPVADVRAEPTPHAGGYIFDSLQETQVEKGEPVSVYEKKGSWARIEASDQLEYTHNNRWQGYPGWVPSNALSKNLLEIRIVKKSTGTEDEIRQMVLAKAALHLGAPYYWGGRSLHTDSNKDVLTSVDCSGLVNWSFKENGILVPRDAHEQYMRARPVDPQQLKPADLIFTAKEENPQKITHVAFYAGHEEILEAPQSGEKVRKITFKEKYGKARADLKNGTVLDGRVIYFGTFKGEGL